MAAAESSPWPGEHWRPPEAAPLPVLDSTRLLARAAFDTAHGQRALPIWRGGPVAD
jgi:hypothetical protein